MSAAVEAAIRHQWYPLATQLEGEISFPIYYEDTDFSGYVFQPNYLKYLDRGREELLGIQRLQELCQLPLPKGRSL